LISRSNAGTADRLQTRRNVVFTEDNRVALPLQPGQWKQFIVPQLVFLGFPEKVEHQAQVPDLGTGSAPVKILALLCIFRGRKPGRHVTDAVHVRHDGDIFAGRTELFQAQIDHEGFSPVFPRGFEGSGLYHGIVRNYGVGHVLETEILRWSGRWTGFPRQPTSPPCFRHPRNGAPFSGAAGLINDRVVTILKLEMLGLQEQALVPV
jgi:hypothetical protein